MLAPVEATAGPPVVASGYSERGELMLHAERAWDEAWGRRDTDTLRRMLADDALLHADGLVFEEDVRGAEAVAQVLASYLRRYCFDHDPIARAVNEETGAAFGFWQDQGLRRDGEEAVLDASVAGMWKLVMREGEPMVHRQDIISELWILRQLNSEENEYRLHDEYSFKGAPVEAGKYVHPHLPTDPQRSEAMRRAAERFSAMWQTGDTSGAEELLKENAHSTDLLHGHSKKHRDSYLRMIQQVHQGWQSSHYSLDVAVTPNSDKAFVHWVAEGKEVGAGGATGTTTGTTTGSTAVTSTTLVNGMSLLVFDPADGKIQEVLGLRQMFPSERRKMLKAGPFEAELKKPEA